ncbi:cytochrome c-type biogenesis protein [Algiphilus aromaticivorans]|uniref:cytochrome c-type biogenesis protein n=1 Tax=Algiphilus aromaticivorans TaxID=382454 RepID=UPI0005C1371C|nr:cytochrome c-type biogenesis protein [Algiphilus aromaticivorans]
MRRGLQWLLVVFVVIGSFGAPLQAQEHERIPLTAEQEQRFHRLANELRCLVCQNQSIAESNAPLAQDLKERVRRQISEGRSDEEIKNYMRDRYGDFVLYKPPFNAVTAVLWISPLILLGVGAIWLALRMRRARADDLPDDEPEHLER